MATSITDAVRRIFDRSVENVTTMLFENRSEDLVVKSLEDLVSKERKAVIKEIGRNWDFFYGNHEPYFKQYLGETREEFLDKDKPEFNYTRLVIEEYIKGVMGQSVQFEIADPAVQTWWDGLTASFNMTNFLKKTQRISELSYDCLVIPRWDGRLEQVYFEEVRGEYVRYYPDLDNPKKLGMIAISYLYDTGVMHSDSSSLVKRVELWSLERIKIIEYAPRLKQRRVVFDEENPYRDADGLPVIPIAVFQPEEDDNTFYGYGNAGDISKINQFYNNVWMNLQRIVLFQSFSILFVKSPTKIQVEIAPTRFMKSNDPDADVSYVTPAAKIEEVRKVREDFKNELLDISRVPTEVLTGSKKDLPASGFSLMVKRMPIEHLWAEKKASYSDSLKNLVHYSNIVQNTHGKKVGSSLDYSINIEWGMVKIPIESWAQNLIEAFEVEQGLETPVTLYMKRHEVTREEAEEIIIRNLEETKRIREALMGGIEEKGQQQQKGGFMERMNEVFQTPHAPEPEDLSKARGGRT